MASISTDANGNRKIYFTDLRGKRRRLCLGGYTRKAVDEIKTKVEAILAASRAKVSLDRETAKWLGDIDATLHAKLVSRGLAQEREVRQSMTVAAFLDGYIAGRTDVKPLTAVRLKDSRAKLVAFFGADKPLDAVTPGDADAYRRHLLTTLGDNTVRRQCGRAKQYFRAAVRKRLIAENPFADMKGCRVQANRERDYFVSRDEAEKVLDACPDSQWRLLFALSRYGGLRCPSEHLALKWGDINWDAGRMTVHSPKTEHHEGKDSRIVPIFPELLPDLEAVWDEAPEGTEYVITRYRDCNANLRTQLNRIIRRAGLKPWPKLFQNLRATRETELAEEFPAHVVCQSIGNSEAVARKHYLQVTDAHFEQARTRVQNRVHREDSQPFSGIAEIQPDCDSAEKISTAELAGAPQCSVKEQGIPPRGFEPRFSD